MRSANPDDARAVSEALEAAGTKPTVPPSPMHSTRGENSCRFRHLPYIAGRKELGEGSTSCKHATDMQ
jgi:hypothetical protein